MEWSGYLNWGEEEEDRMQILWLKELWVDLREWGGTFFRNRWW